MVHCIDVLWRNLFSHKLIKDIAWSMSSFFTLAVSGIMINIALTALRDVAALGVFNLAYAVYIIISQFAVWGVNYSVLRHAAYYKESATDRGHMLFTSGMIALVLGTLFAILTVWASPLAAMVFDSPDTGAAIRYAAFGLILFPLNKVLLAYLNGLREMKSFSILQGLRYFLVMLFVSAVAATDWPIECTTLAFLFAETVTVTSAIVFIVKQRLHGHLAFSIDWVHKHFSFGTKGLAGGILAEVNSQIDVLLIGFFLSERTTGIYSFSAMLVEGLYHVLAMIRINFNPVLVTAVRDKNWDQILRLRVQSARYVFPIMLTLSALLVLAYIVLTTQIIPGKGLQEGLASLLILLFGLNMISVFVPFDNLMVISGYPGYQTIQQLITVIANIGLTTVLLPLLGLEAAALGAAFSYLVGIIMLIFFTSQLLGWRLVTNLQQNPF